MGREPFSVPETIADPSVMAAVDDAGGVPRLVIADLEAEDSWLSVPVEAALELAEYR